MQKKTLLINLFGGPGAGKTVAAMELAVGLKKLGYEVEYLPEYAKQLYYEDQKEMLDGSLEHEIEIISEIYNRLMIYNGKVDVIVSDSALLQSVNYVKTMEAKKAMLDVAYDYHRQFRNINYFVARNHNFKEEGRVHSLEESLAIDNEIYNFMEEIEAIDIIDDRNDKQSINRQIFNIAILLEDLKDVSENVPSVGHYKVKNHKNIYTPSKEEGYYKNYHAYYQKKEDTCYIPKTSFKGKNKKMRLYSYRDFLRIARYEKEAQDIFEDIAGELPETLVRKRDINIKNRLNNALKKIQIKEQSE